MKYLRLNSGNYIQKSLRFVMLAVVALISVSSMTQLSAYAAPAVVGNDGVTPIYRFYRNTGGHFYTSSKTERNSIISTNRAYSYEGIAFYGYSTQVASTSPVYRLYNKNTGYHFYTINQSEYLSVAANTATYRDEGVAYYASMNTGTSSIPVYRFYNYKLGLHFYTSTESEKNTLVSTQSGTFRFEGVAYYVADPNGLPGSNSFYMTPRLASIGINQTFTMAIRATTVDPVNVAQVSIQYDANKLQMLGVTEGSTFTQFAATDTSTPGVIRIARSTPTGTTAVGDNPFVYVSFKMLVANNQTTVTINPAQTYLVRASDSQDISNLVGSADYWAD